MAMEAFDFTRSRDLEAHLRLTAGWRLNEHFFVLGGYDDFLTDDQDSLFLGGGVRWQDDDLKYLLGTVAGGL
jgi:phospholipid/cholesterol/gamma-HCH transport system substrate-binding protein